MASNTIYIPGGDIDEELETEILEIYTTGPNSSVIINADIEDNQKRWLIVGICIQFVLSPILRKFTEQVAHKLYNVIQNTNGIQTQTYPNQLRKYPSSGRDLNYAAINNNHSIPRVRRQPDVGKYDYKVTSHVDFSKLFLATSMAHYTAFNETCDLSALLGIIINIDQFPKPVQSISLKVRSDVRNPWAHCNFDEWDTIKYQTAFQLLHQLVRCLQLNTTDETNIQAELNKWETNGFMFLQGYGVNQQVVKEIRQQTRALADYTLKMKSGLDSTFAHVHDAIFKINGEIMLACSRISSIESKQNEQQTDIDNFHTHVSVLYDRTLAIENVQTEHGMKIEKHVSNTAAIVENTDKLKIKNDLTTKKMSKLENENKIIKEEISDIKTDIIDIKIDIKDFRNYFAMSKPAGKTLFYPPNRSETFIAREVELSKLKDICIGKCNENHTLVICGLGGCGKTTLAIEFAWRSQEYYPAGVFWMSAETQDSLEDSLTTLAIDVDTTGKDFRETFKRTLKWLSSLNERWLLVVDNIDEEYLSDNTKQLLLGSWKRNTRGHILITSRRGPNEVEESMVVRIENCINLNVFEKGEGLYFFRRRTGINCNHDNDTVMSLVEELGGLPLALEQAAAHIKSIKCSFSDYVNKFKKKRLKLLKAAFSPIKINKSRLAITTTWKLNIDYITRQSENEGLGTAAATVMQIASFLFADDIPLELINVGSPFVDDSSLVEVLDDEIGCKQVIEILTRFSLFQRKSDSSLSVHRLVQEVIRDDMHDTHRCLILQHAMRMVNKALYSSQSPVDVMYNDDSNTKEVVGTLVKWGKFAANANSIKMYVFNLKKDEIPEHQLFFNKEILRILQTTALYHSIHQRQAIALADQAQMIRIMTTVDVDTHFFNDLTKIKIPLLQRDREKIVDCLVSVIPVETKETGKYTPVVTAGAETLRILGNEAFKEQRYQDAIRYYTAGIKSSPITHIDCRLFSNRSIAYIRIRDFTHAFSDANRCIDIESENWKGYCWKAYAISGLIEDKTLPPTMEAMGLASACIASYKHPPCLLQCDMLMRYPIINYQMVERPEWLRQNIVSLTDRPFTTLLLRKGLYTFNEKLITTKSIQVIGIEDGVDIDTGPGLHIYRFPSGSFVVDYEPEQTIKTHFENVNFVSGNQILVHKNCIATFYKCTFSNGKKGCDAFPKCIGNIGCVNPLKCRQSYQERLQLFETVSFGQNGDSGIAVCDGGIAYIDACLFNRCGGGGVLSDGKGSFIDMKNCTVQNMIQMGIEVRNEGAVKISKNTISQNQTHGIAIGPNGYAFIEENIIQGNGSEGIWCGGVSDSNEWENLNDTGASKAVLIDNDIGQNGLSGISCDGCYIEIKGNRIFSNNCWGIVMKLRSSAYILDNDIFDNKCGGIRIGHNYTASVIIDGNTIRDHNGPGVYTVKSIEKVFNKIKDWSDSFVGNGEICGYSRPPVITSTNLFKNNDKGTLHPSEVVRLIEACSFCRQVSHNLKACSKCKKATYCSKDCQSKHWLRHKHMCKLLRSSYVVEVPMSEIEPNNFGASTENYEPNAIRIRRFNPKLKGILEGTPPNRRSHKRFIVKIQSGKEYAFYNPNKKLVVYDQTVKLDIQFSNPTLYHLCMECGVLASAKLTTKTIFCWASFKNNGNTLCFHIDNLPPFQMW